MATAKLVIEGEVLFSSNMVNPNKNGMLSITVTFSNSLGELYKKQIKTAADLKMGDGFTELCEYPPIRDGSALHAEKKKEWSSHFDGKHFCQLNCPKYIWLILNENKSKIEAKDIIDNDIVKIACDVVARENNLGKKYINLIPAVIQRVSQAIHDYDPYVGLLDKNAGELAGCDIVQPELSAKEIDAFEL